MFDLIKKLIRLNKLRKLWKNKDLISPKWWNEFISTLLSIKEVNEFARNYMDKLKGYKTYLLAAGIVAITVAHALGYIDDATKNTLLSLLGAGTAVTLAAKINRTEEIAKINELKTSQVLSNTMIYGASSGSGFGSAGANQRVQSTIPRR